MFGVIQKTYDAYRTKKGLPIASVRYIATTELQDIYLSYWMDSGCDNWGTLLSITVLDMAINGGEGTAVKELQTVAGVTVDGVLGPATIAAVQALDDKQAADAFCWVRLRRYANIVEANAAEQPNLLGWLIRVLQFKEKYL